MEESRDTIDNIKNAETAVNQDPPAASPASETGGSRDDARNTR